MADNELFGISEQLNDLISRQAAIDEIEYELEMINLALDSITLDFNARERLRQRKGEAREILNSIQQLPSVQPEIIQCKNCKDYQEGVDINGKPFSRCNGSVRTYGHTMPDWYCADAERRADE